VTVRVWVAPDRYADSVTLMAASQELSSLTGVTQAVLVMGTPRNKEQLERVGLLTAEAAAARPADLVVAVAGPDADAVNAAMERAAAFLAAPAGQFGVDGRPGGVQAADGDWKGGREPVRSLRAAAREFPEARLALVSVPGAHAALEARHALEAGLDVMLYSDNVPLEAEVALKRLARAKGRLLMGPDCGTAMIGGVGLGFANAVRSGPVGIVAASGTGAQEIACHLHRLGTGVSAILGTGGRDLTGAVGGVMTLEALRRLEEDPATGVIVLVSKVPDPVAAASVADVTRASRKPVVTCFLGALGASLDGAAAEAAALVTGRPPEELEEALGYRRPLAALALPEGRRKVQGLFSGGTLCQQARRILGAQHNLLDLGDDLFTVGRPHPMIDPTLRCQSLLAAAADPQTAVILSDVVLGYGAHPDPAGALAGAIAEAGARGVPVVTSVTGTEGDPQGLGYQVERLTRAGALVCPTARLAAITVCNALERRLSPCRSST
jgi:FdrA protein